MAYNEDVLTKDSKWNCYAQNKTSPIGGKSWAQSKLTTNWTLFPPKKCAKLFDMEVDCRTAPSALGMLILVETQPLPSE